MSISPRTVLFYTLCSLVVALVGCGSGKGKSTGTAEPTIPVTKNTSITPAPLKSGERITNSIGMELIAIPAGEFEMGEDHAEGEDDSDSSPKHRIKLTRMFLMGKYEVTQGQFMKIMGTNPSYFSPQGGGDYKIPPDGVDRFPVDSVSWEDATEFCRRLSELPAELGAGRSYRLPTEAEWEYACRAGTTTRYPSGSKITSAEANISRNSEDSDQVLDRTTTVGSYSPNAWGLYDMIGNVNEWCNDWYDRKYYRISPANDPAGPENGTFRVLRGGCWYVAPVYSRSVSRDNRSPIARDKYNGFRVVFSPK